MASIGKLFDDVFTIERIDSKGKKFDRVSRIEGPSETHDMQLTLDVNFDLFPLKVGERITLFLVSTLHPDADAGDEMDVDGGASKARREAWRGGDEGLAKDFEYVTYGKVYKFEDSPSAVAGDKQATAYISYGGLLMSLRGTYRALSTISVGSNVYCLIRK